MRSFTLEDKPGRCKRCLILEKWCVCGVLPTVNTRTEVVIVRHERESWKSTGTARIAELAMPKLRIIEYREDAEPALSALPAEVQGAHLLFPTDSTTPFTEVKKIILIDGTWRQTRKMYGKLPPLHAVPRLALPEKQTRVLRLRESKFEAGRSTLEAIAEAIELIEGPEAAVPLFALHSTYVEHVFRARGVWDQKLGDFEA